MKRTILILFAFAFAACEDYDITNHYGVPCATPDAGNTHDDINHQDASPGAGDAMSSTMRANSVAWGRTERVPSSFDPANPNATSQGREVRLAEIDVSDDPMQDLYGLTAYVGATSFVGGGPLVGVIRFGRAGANLHTVEFDVPTGIGQPINGGSTALVSGTNGIFVQVPGSSMIVAVRNDGNASVTYVPPVPGTRVNGGAGSLNNNPEVAGFIHRGYPAKAGYPLTKTVYVTDMTGAVPFLAGDASPIIKPNFAKRLRLSRVNAALTAMPGPILIEVFATGIGGTRSKFAVLGVNDEGPVELDNGDNEIVIHNNTGANMFSVRATFDLEL